MCPWSVPSPVIAVSSLDPTRRIFTCWVDFLLLERLSRTPSFWNSPSRAPPRRTYRVSAGACPRFGSKTIGNRVVTGEAAKDGVEYVEQARMIAGRKDIQPLRLKKRTGAPFENRLGACLLYNT